MHVVYEYGRDHLSLYNMTAPLFLMHIGNVISESIFTHAPVTNVILNQFCYFTENSLGSFENIECDQYLDMEKYKQLMKAATVPKTITYCTSIHF